jgi:hypothetical protein
MAMTLDYSAVTATTLTLTFGGTTPGTYANIDVQYSTRPDFLFVPSPLFTIATAANYQLTGLNQGCLLWVRAREKTAGGAVQPWTTPALMVYLPISVARVTTPATIMVTPAIVVMPTPIRQVVPAGVVAGYPGSNLLTDSPGEQCWFTGTTIDFETSGEPIDTFALLSTNIPAAGTWRVMASATQGGLAAPTYNLGVDVSFQPSAGLPGRPYYHGLLRLVAPQAFRWWRIQFTAAAAPPANLKVATFMVAGLARTAKNIAADKVESPLDYGALDRLRDGTADRRIGYRGRRVEFDIAMLTEAQWETQFADLRQRIALTDPALVVPNMQSNAFLHDRILYGPVQSNRVQQPNATRFTKSLAIESLI